MKGKHTRDIRRDIQRDERRTDLMIKDTSHKKIYTQIKRLTNEGTISLYVTLCVGRKFLHFRRL